MCFFFFKQKTAYEMRISDWSSDVCSSDLQTGSTGDTDSTVTQIGDNNVAGVTQSGDNNNVTISQTQNFIPTAEDPSNEATVTQEGVDGALTILQEGDNNASVTQDSGSVDDDAFHAQVESGRAARRERGWQEV